MILSQNQENRCSCCHNLVTSTSFSFVITYYIFQKQTKQATIVKQNEEQFIVSHFDKNMVLAR